MFRRKKSIGSGWAGWMVDGENRKRGWLEIDFKQISQGTEFEKCFHQREGKSRADVEQERSLVPPGPPSPPTPAMDSMTTNAGSPARQELGPR